MLARCYLCHADFETHAFGTQRCPACGAEVYLQEPGSAPPTAGPVPDAAPVGAPARSPGDELDASGMSPAPEPPPAGSAGAGWGPPPPSWPPPPPPPGWTPLPPGAMAPVAEQSAPFADRRGRGFFGAFFQTWKLVALEPARFFRQVRIGESRWAVLFGVISLSVGMWVSLFVQYFTTRAALPWVTRLTERLGANEGADTSSIVELMKGSPAGLLVQVLVTPIFALFTVYLVTAVLHVALLAVKGAPRGFDATLTLVGYACGIFLLEALPVCGGLIALVWYCFVAIHGLSEVQRCGTGKAAFAVLMPVLLLCACACLSGAVAGFAGLSGLGKGAASGGSVGL